MKSSKRKDENTLRFFREYAEKNDWLNYMKKVIRENSVKDEDYPYTPYNTPTGSP